MLAGIFDTHAHMDDPCFSAQLDEVLSEQKRKGVVGIINSGSDLLSSARSCEMADKYDFVYASVGIYPNETADLPNDYLKQLEYLCKNKKVVAVGEIGMDYGFEGHPNAKIQELRFREQLELAKSVNLPVVIHDRDADTDTLRIIKDYSIKGEIHRIFSPLKVALKFMEMGIYMGIGPQITYPDSECLIELVREMPLELLLLETDAPFLPPSHLIGESAKPDMISFVAEKISSLRGDVTAQEVLDIARENAKLLYNIK
ncbi:MAG: TatD family hydrolase [Candidatus Metalachnospira sp.]|nr:TatD family hydrolase [Candidatus Metalachnospira sp.]